MIRFMKLLSIGMIAGLVLLGFLKIVQLATNNTAYMLLINTDYIPLLQNLQPRSIIGFTFHFVFCVISVLSLFYMLIFFQLEKKLSFYFIVYTVGSALLFPLTALSDSTPVLTDTSAFIYWVVAHGLYSFVVGILIKKWV